MTRNVITIDLRNTVFDAAKVMSEKKIGCLLVTDGKVPVGIVSERDFVRKVVAEKLPLDTKISEIMSKPLIAVDLDASLIEAARLMLKNKIRRLPVVKKNKLVGIIVASDFVRQLSKKTVTEELLEDIARCKDLTEVATLYRELESQIIRETYL